MRRRMAGTLHQSTELASGHHKGSYSRACEEGAPGTRISDCECEQNRRSWFFIEGDEKEEKTIGKSQDDQKVALARVDVTCKHHETNQSKQPE